MKEETLLGDLPLALNFRLVQNFQCNVQLIFSKDHCGDQNTMPGKELPETKCTRSSPFQDMEDLIPFSQLESLLTSVTE